MTRSEAIHHAFQQARIWQLIAIACLAVLILAVVYIGHMHVRQWACFGGL